MLGVFAHPDDEMGVVGTLAMYAAQGAKVHLVCVTRGELGEISDPSLASRESLGKVREGELRKVCRILGIEEPFFLGYRDSGMPGTADNSHPASLNQADPAEVMGKLVRLIRQLRPQVVLTFDERGIYGHPDHLAIHRHTKEAFFLAGDKASYSEQFSRGISPFSPQRLYYFTIPRSRLRQMVQQMEAAGITMPSDFPDPEDIGTPDEEVTTAIDVSSYLELKRRATAAHRTQQGPNNPFAQLPEEALVPLFRTEFFHRAYPPHQVSQMENTLF